MRPQRRKFELALVDIRRCLVDPPVEDRVDALPWAAYQIGRFVKVLASDPERTRALIDTVRAVRESPGPGSTVAETDLMKALSSIAYWCADEMAEGSPPDAEQRQEVLRELSTYATECLGFRRSRDSFGGHRRSMAFAILARANPHVEVPEAALAARSIVQSGSGNDFHGAIQFLLERFQARDEAPDDELVDALIGVAERAKTRSIAVGALNLLVETGAISDWEALSRIDGWKERNLPRH